MSRINHLIKQTLAILIVTSFLCTTVSAQESSTSPQQSTPSYPSAKKAGLCAQERHNVRSSCRNKPCTPECLHAHQEFKECRAANNLPSPKPNKKRKTPPCKSMGGLDGSQGAAPIQNP